MGFKARVGSAFICIAEANVMYIPWDPPLVLHIANLLMDSILGCWPVSYLAQRYYCVAAVSLEPAINRSWVLRTNHWATRPGPNVIVFDASFSLPQWENWSLGSMTSCLRWERPQWCRPRQIQLQRRRHNQRQRRRHQTYQTPGRRHNQRQGRGTTPTERSLWV